MDDARKTALSGWPPTTPETVYAYCFAVWPDETSPRMAICPAVFELFRQMQTRTQVELTERAFNDFRESLSHIGITLREIERAPYLVPVGVL